jgi:beta-1,4-mannosyltransferase
VRVSLQTKAKITSRVTGIQKLEKKLAAPLRVLAAPAFKTAHLNPYCSLLYAEMERLGAQVKEFSIYRVFPRRFDILHVHWPEFFISQKNFFKAFLGSILLLWECKWGRWLGARIVWTAHNTYSHNRTHPRSERLFWRAFTRLVDGFICLSEQGFREIRHAHLALQGLPSLVIPHGHYRGEYQRDLDRSEARSRLGLPADAKVLLFFGTIAPYKNVIGLIRVFQELPDSKLRLIVAGTCADPVLKAGIIDAAREDARISLRLDFVPGNEVQVYFQASDLVVLPFVEIFNSGSALLALSFDRPLLAPHLGSIPELQRQVGAGWIRTYGGEVSVRVLRDAMRWSITEKREPEAPLEPMGWEPIAAATLDFFLALRTGAPKGAPQQETEGTKRESANGRQALAPERQR